MQLANRKTAACACEIPRAHKRACCGSAFHRFKPLIFNIVLVVSSSRHAEAGPEGHRDLGRVGAVGRLLLGARPPVAAQLHVQVQGDGGGGATPPLAARVPQRVAARRSAQEVSASSPHCLSDRRLSQRGAHNASERENAATSFGPAHLQANFERFVFSGMN